MKIKLIVWTLLAVMIGCLTRMSYGANLEKLIRNTEPKVVKIGIVGEKGAGTCSGSFISSTGIVLTCAHCFSHDKIKKVFIKTSDEKVYKAALLDIDFTNDLALVLPDAIGPFEYFKLGKEPIRGQQVLAFGSPLGMQHTASVGWVSNIINQTKIWIMHSAFISPGNSGGPLVNLRGELVGVNEALITYGFLQVAQGLFVAIDVITVKEFLWGCATL